MKRHPIYIALFIGVVLMMPDQVSAQHLLFASHDVLELTLTTSLETLIQDVGEERDEHPAFISYQNADGDVVMLPLKVETRGNYRRNPEHCSFPPLRLNFPKKTVRRTLFHGQDKIKLVTHCQTDMPEHEQLLLKEYLVYRIYNELTDRSFLVRPARITYQDSTDLASSITRYAFFIEDEDLMAERNGALEFNKDDVGPDHMDFEQMTLFYLFEYMIGNIDWNVEMRQNLKLIGPETGRPLTAVPYDFDFAGLVDPHYADPTPQLGKGTLRHQMFTDFCRTPDELVDAIALLNERRDTIEDLFQSLEDLEPEPRRLALRHIDKFYRTINDPEAVEREFIRPCQG